MIYSAFRATATRLLRTPALPPDAPPGNPSTAEQFRASPRYLSKQLLLNLLGATTLLLIEGFAWFQSPSSTWLSRQVTTAILAFTGLSILSTYLLTRLEYDLRYYVVSDQCLRIRRGIWIVEESTYTLANVQTVAIKQSPVDRAFGLCNLHIETAGGGSGDSSQHKRESGFHRGLIQGVDLRHSEQLQRRLLHNVAQYLDSGLGEAPRQGASPQVPSPAHPTFATTAVLQLLRAISSELRQINRSKETSGTPQRDVHSQ